MKIIHAPVCIYRSDSTCVVYLYLFSIYLTGQIPVQNVSSYLVESSDNLTASLNFLAFCRNSKFITVLTKSRHFFPFLSHMIPVHALSSFVRIRSNIILTPARRSSVRSLSLRVSQQNSVCITLLSHACSAPGPSHPRCLISQIICGVEMICPVNVGSSDTYTP